MYCHMAGVILNRINIAPVTLRCMTSLAIGIMGIYCRNVYVCDLVHEKKISGFTLAMVANNASLAGAHVRALITSGRWLRKRGALP